jgi:hypothetical protein
MDATRLGGAFSTAAEIALELIRRPQVRAAELLPVATDVAPLDSADERRPDFLLTRLLEVVVHSDDLAVGVGVPTPEFPGPAFAPVRDLLVRLAVRRHGQSGLISTLARSERVRPVSAF